MAASESDKKLFVQQIGCGKCLFIHHIKQLPWHGISSIKKEKKDTLCFLKEEITITQSFLPPPALKNLTLTDSWCFLTLNDTQRDDARRICVMDTRGRNEISCFFLIAFSSSASVRRKKNQPFIWARVASLRRY